MSLTDESDSAVYGWRNAEIENLEKMLKGESCSPLYRASRPLARFAGRAVL